MSAKSDALLAIVRAQFLKDNEARLAKCLSHSFVPTTMARYECIRCLGLVNETALKWYELGRMHATRK